MFTPHSVVGWIGDLALLGMLGTFFYLIARFPRKRIIRKR